MISLMVDESTLEINKRNSITGSVFFQIENSYFPEFKWNDFIVVILTWWKSSIKLLETSSVGTTIDFNFMDGPFYIHGVKKNNTAVSLSFTRRHKVAKEVILTVDTEISSFKKSIDEASSKVIREMHSRKWITEETKQLEKLL